MRRFPDSSGLVTRRLVPALLPCLGGALLWLVHASAEAPGGEAGGAPPTADAAAIVEPLERAPESAVGEEQRAAQELYAWGRQLWAEYVPADLRREYAFPSMEELQGFLARLETELHSDSTQQLAAHHKDARRALKVLRRYHGGELLAAWLEPRLDLIRAAAQIEATRPAPWPEVQAGPHAPQGPELAPSPVVPTPDLARPQYTRGYWDRVLTRRKMPRRAESLVPRLKEVFSAMGVPPELVWIAEVESSMNPEATSPVGARGLFQFMPLTAARFGLDTGVMLDERTDPEKSARAAAEYLRVLHRRFRSWPLALAAYNAGEGRVGRALTAEKAATFDAVAHRLPVETRMYVPKVLATVAAREAVDPEALPGPGEVRSVPAQWVSDAAPAASGSDSSQPATSL